MRFYCAFETSSYASSISAVSQNQSKEEKQLLGRRFEEVDGTMSASGGSSGVGGDSGAGASGGNDTSSNNTSPAASTGKSQSGNNFTLSHSSFY